MRTPPPQPARLNKSQTLLTRPSGHPGTLVFPRGAGGFYRTPGWFESRRCLPQWHGCQPSAATRRSAETRAHGQASTARSRSLGNSAPRDHLDPGLPDAEPTESGALTDGEGGASGGRGGAARSGGCWRPADRARAGAGPGGKGFANTQGLTGGETHRHGGLTATETTGLGGRSPGDGGTGGPAALPALRASLPPWRVGSRPAQAPRRRRRRWRRRRRRQSHGLLLWRGRAAPTDSRPLG